MMVKFKRELAILISTLRIRVLPMERAEAVENGPLAEIEFMVPRMVCEGCAETISAALQSVPGVREVKPLVAQKHVLIRYEPQRVKGPQLKGALEKAGFAAVEA
jgi:P-type Cu+ transporter